MAKTDTGFQTALVLHVRPYRESSQLVELFSQEHGRLGLVANGSRRQKSGHKALLQPFVPLQIRWRGAGDLKTLERLEPLALPVPLQGTALFSGLYLNELLYYLLERHTPYPGLFSRYVQSLAGLAVASDPQPVLRRFELALLQALGYGVALEQTADGEPVLAETDYCYRHELGLTLATVATPAAERLPGAHLLAMAADRLETSECLTTAKRLCRLALKPYLGDRPLRSRELFSTSMKRTME
ncbi:DNA repair protein RecO [Pseudaeromonas paramecii]|uniref:DNA repair protein RecO n=1 Tax=Pseudaeromonas paramecii TaxID=2138166 RepID=A0ABP8QA97_9GAMM